MLRAKVAVVLSGCGHLDGAEIRRSVLTLLYLDIAGAEVSIFAPDINQHHVINHYDDKAQEGQSRKVLAESARIARGQIAPLSTLDPASYDALILPGGYGAAKNLSDFAFKGADCAVIAELQSVIEAFYQARKPMGAICIAPVLLATALKGKGLTLTIGEDAGVASAIESLGHHHQKCPTDSCVIDHHNRITTCSAYMREDSLANVAQGIEKLVASVLSFT